MSTSKFAVGLLIAMVMAAGVVGLFWSHTSAEETGLIHLAPGWNLVGWTSEKQSVSEALAPNRVYGLPDTVLAVYGYNNESQSFTRHIFGRPEISTLTDFEPEQAYWVLSKARTTWWVPNRASCPACPACPACPSPEPTDELLVEYVRSEFCTSLKIRIETGEVLLEIAEAGLLVGQTASEVRADIATGQQAFDSACQGVPLSEFTIIGSACAEAGRWVGIEDTTMLYAPSAQSQAWGARFKSIVHKYCSTQ